MQPQLNSGQKSLIDIKYNDGGSKTQNTLVVEDGSESEEMKAAGVSDVEDESIDDEGDETIEDEESEDDNEESEEEWGVASEEATDPGYPEVEEEKDANIQTDTSAESSQEL